MLVKFKKVFPTAKIPTRGSVDAAGYDLYSDFTGFYDDKEVISIQPHETIMVPTNISMEIPQGYFGAIYARSGLASKEGLRPANCVGVVDSDYRGNIFVALHNDSNIQRCVENHQRIAQIIIQPFLSIEFEEVNELNNTERGSGGFESTGRK